MRAVVTVLPEAVWRARRDAHERRVDAWTQPFLARAAHGEKHPVEDFLFTYYRHRPAQLRRWSPGQGVVLEGAPAESPLVACSGGSAVGPPDERTRRLAAITADLLEQTASRPAQLGCFGLHEWAMEHGRTQDEVRHTSWPLRLGQEGTTALVEQLPLRCTHLDAFRFFPDSARRRNSVQLTRETQRDDEQPGCLHATMDLYKHAHRLSPHVPSELVADAFALARHVRALDMRASPYDLSELGYEPVPVETAEGRAQYVAEQRAFSEQGAELRARLLVAVGRIA